METKLLNFSTSSRLVVSLSHEKERPNPVTKIDATTRLVVLDIFAVPSIHFFHPII
jgi:hypothetical protein